MKYKAKSVVVRPDDEEPEIWELKCKPSCWRLYFYVYNTQDFKAFLFLLAVCKKRNAADPADVTTARNLFKRVKPQGSGVIAFEFPS